MSDTPENFEDGELQQDPIGELESGALLHPPPIRRKGSRYEQTSSFSLQTISLMKFHALLAATLIIAIAFTVYEEVEEHDCNEPIPLYYDVVPLALSLFTGFVILPSMQKTVVTPEFRRQTIRHTLICYGFVTIWYIFDYFVNRSCTVKSPHSSGVFSLILLSVSMCFAVVTLVYLIVHSIIFPYLVMNCTPVTGGEARLERFMSDQLACIIKGNCAVNIAYMFATLVGCGMCGGLVVGIVVAVQGLSK